MFKQYLLNLLNYVIYNVEALLRNRKMIFPEPCNINFEPQKYVTEIKC